MTAIRNRNSKKGFTLVEILIVVIILGILAAIVIPQFTSASQDARKNAVKSMVQTLRSQIELYKLQHGDQLPDLVTDWDPFLQQTTYGGQNFGPYMQSAPRNGLTNSDVVADGDAVGAAAATDGWVYDDNAGTGTGRIWGVETDTTGTVVGLIGD
jgi:general secretion pathway protein G